MPPPPRARCPMFIRHLSSFSSSILPRGSLSLLGSGLRGVSASSAPPPLSSWQPPGFPPCHHPPPPYHPPVRPFLQPAPVRNLSGGSLHSSATLGMEPPRVEASPPHKRRKKKELEGRKDKSRTRMETEKQEAYSSAERGPHASNKDPNPWFKGRKEDAGSAGGSDPGLSSWHWSSASSLRSGEYGGAPGQPPPPGLSPPARHQPVLFEKALKRRWEASSTCSDERRPHGGGAAFDFSVLSYNILSQELLQDNVDLYRHCPRRVLHWEYRLPNLLAEIQKYNADIVCLQEVQEDHYENQIKPALQAQGYQCEYKKRTGRKPDGCAVIFRASRLSLLASSPVEFFRPGDALLDRDNVGLVLLLRPNDTAADPSAFICVANTHLLYNPRRGDVKLAQLAILLAEISRLSRLPDGSRNPVVLCGDFNSTPWSPLYSFLTTGRLKYQGLQIGMVSGQEESSRAQRLLPTPLWSRSLGINYRCQYDSELAAKSSPRSPTAEAKMADLSVEGSASEADAPERIEHSLKLQSTYRHRLMPDGRPEVTTFHSRTAMTVDYILYSPEPGPSPAPPCGRGLQLLGRLSLVGQSELKKVNGLPNHRHSSDHLPLLASFRFLL